DAGHDRVGQRVARNLDPLLAAEFVKPQLAMLTARILPQVDVSVPFRIARLLGASGSLNRRIPAIREFREGPLAAPWAWAPHRRAPRCRRGSGRAPRSSMVWPRSNRWRLNGALSGCGRSCAIVWAKHQPDAGVALKPP